MCSDDLSYMVAMMSCQKSQLTYLTTFSSTYNKKKLKWKTFIEMILFDRFCFIEIKLSFFNVYINKDERRNVDLQ